MSTPDPSRAWWPLDVLFSERGQLVLVRGGTRDRFLVEGLVHGLQRSGGPSTRGALTPVLPAFLVSDTVPVARLSSGGVWGKSRTLAGLDPLALGRTADGLAAGISALPMRITPPPGQSSPWKIPLMLVVGFLIGRSVLGLFRAVREGQEELEEAWNRDHETAVLGTQGVAVREAVQSGDLAVFRAIVEPMKPAERAVWVDALGFQLPVSKLDEWCESEPTSALPFYVRGHARHRWGWNARGGAWAADVTDAQRATFEGHLLPAIEDLTTAAELGPADVQPLVVQLHAMMGIEASIADVQTCFDEGLERDPLSFGLHRAMMMASSAKWLGSHPQMFGIARRARKIAPNGHPLHALIVLAHIERWVELCWEDVEDADEYLRTGFAVTESLAAFKAFEDGAEVETATLLAWNTFAMVLDQAGEVEAARRCFAAIDGRYTVWPWQCLGDPAEQFNGAQERAEFA